MFSLTFAHTSAIVITPIFTISFRSRYMFSQTVKNRCCLFQSRLLTRPFLNAVYNIESIFVSFVLGLEELLFTGPDVKLRQNVGTDSSWGGGHVGALLRQRIS